MSWSTHPKATFHTTLSCLRTLTAYLVYLSHICRIYHNTVIIIFKNLPFTPSWGRGGGGGGVRLPQARVLNQMPESLRVLCSIIAFPRTALRDSDVVPGATLPAWGSQPVMLGLPPGPLWTSPSTCGSSCSFSYWYFLIFS